MLQTFAKSKTRHYLLSIMIDRTNSFALYVLGVNISDGLVVYNALVQAAHEIRVQRVHESRPPPYPDAPHPAGSD